MWFNFFKIKFAILLLSLVFISCQQDEEMVIEEDLENLMTEKVIELVMKVAVDDKETKIEYNENDCSIIEFPYFFISGIAPDVFVIQVNNDEEVKQVRRIRDSATLRIVYPVKVVKPGQNFPRFVQNDRELEDLKKQICGKEIIVSENILCIDFIYPFNFKMFNTVSSTFKTTTVRADEEVISFINSMKTFEKVMIDYPIELVRMQNKEIIRATYNEEFIRQLETNDNSCL